MIAGFVSLPRLCGAVAACFAAIGMLAFDDMGGLKALTNIDDVLLLRMHSLATEAVDGFRDTGVAPESLEPQSGAVTYARLNASHVRLCAEFLAASPGQTSVSDAWSAQLLFSALTTPRLGRGRHCYTVDVRAAALEDPYWIGF